MLPSNAANTLHFGLEASSNITPLLRLLLHLAAYITRALRSIRDAQGA